MWAASLQPDFFRWSIGNQDDLTAARRDLLQIGDRLFEEIVLGRDDDDRHVLVDQRDRPVLQFPGSIALGMYIRDFLELQRAFERDREA